MFSVRIQHLPVTSESMCYKNMCYWILSQLIVLSQYYLRTYFIVQSPSWETNWFAASQEIPRISRNPKVHYRTQKLPPPYTIRGQPNPVHIPTSHFLKIHPNIIHSSKPRSSQCSVSLRFPHQDPIHPFSSPIRATCPAHLILLYFITRTILDEEYISFSSSLCSLLHSPVTSSLLGQNILPILLGMWNQKGCGWWVVWKKFRGEMYSGRRCFCCKTW